MSRARLWFSRAVMVYGAVVFGALGFLYMAKPLAGISQFGISVSGEPHSVTFLRTSLGALFTAQALIAIYGLARPRYLRTCLIFLVLVNGCIVVARLVGIVVDGWTPLQLSELQTEGFSWLAFVAALIALPLQGDQNL
jgi:hypothetical protein